MHNPQQALMTLSRLADAGIGLTLDDFGTGHSSLSYLTRFPFKTIKIDKSLVIDPSDKGGVLIRSIVNLAKQLEMQVVAEGVASESDAMKLSEIGCDYGQSFLFGPPIGSESVQKLLRERFPVSQTQLRRRSGCMPCPASQSLRRNARQA
jgi:EAL domain-containing protein (putative c-di-GMP-specific phosphodiesterase class I)